MARRALQRVRPGSLRAHLRARLDPLTDAVLVFPLFLAYQIGILGGRGRNGVDYVTNALVALSERDVGNYLLLLVALLVAYAGVLAFLRRRGTFHPRAFVPMLVESAVYALSMGSLIVFLMSRFLGFLPGLAVGLDGGRGPVGILVVSAGAGLHEELVFRVLVMGGLAALLSARTGRRRAWLLALVLSSVIFSLAHHVGSAGEAFTAVAFVYRILAGMVFGVIYAVRGFAVAAWTHALYDVFVLSFHPSAG